VVVTPQTVTAGTSSVFTVKVINETHETIQSVKITAPSDLAINGVPGGSVLFQGLSIPFGPSAVSLQVTATAPCVAPANPGSWTVQASETTPFTPPGDDFEADTASVLVAPAVTGKCSLAFLNGPAGGVPGSPITSQLGSSPPSPVSVEVLDGNGNPTSVPNVSISMSATQDSSPVTLSGTTGGQTNTSGVASFSDLIINQVGSGYRLVASSQGINPAVSSRFTILSSYQPCTGAQCSGSAASSTTAGTVTTSSATSGQFLGLGIGGTALACGGSYKPLSDLVTFDVLNPSGSSTNAVITVTITIAKQVVLNSGHPGASSWQVCFGSTVPFTALPLTSTSEMIDGVTYYAGLLPDCNNTQTNVPCVLSKNKTNAGTEVITFLGFGDMNGRA